MKEITWLVVVVLTARVIALAAGPVGDRLHRGEWEARQRAIQQLIRDTFPEAFASAPSPGSVNAEEFESTHFYGDSAKPGTETK